jgi:ankyrin repeat protein
MAPIVDVNFVSSRDGSTALMLSCASGSVDIVNMLLSRKRSVVEELPLAADGTTCRHHPSSRTVVESHFGTKSPVSLLECLPLARDRQGRQCVAIAAMHGHAEVVRTLLAHSIPYTATDVDGRTALHLAAANGHLAVCEEIVRSEARQWEQFPPLPREAGATPANCSTSSCDETERSKLEMARGKLADSSRRLVSVSKVSGVKSHGKGEPTIRSLVHMTRRPDALLALDVRGSRPADLAAMNGHAEVVSLLQTAVRDVYGCSMHPPIAASKQSHTSTNSGTSASEEGVAVGAGESREVLKDAITAAAGAGTAIGGGAGTGWDDFAEDAAYAFATTLRFPTPPASPKASTGQDNTGGDSDSDDKK